MSSPEGDYQSGKKHFEKICSGCHTADEGKDSPNPDAPNLYGLIGRPFLRNDISQTESFTDAGEWDTDRLDKFLNTPHDFISGGKSRNPFKKFKAGKPAPFEPIKNPLDRKDLITFLRDNPLGDSTSNQSRPDQGAEPSRQASDPSKPSGLSKYLPKFLRKGSSEE